jgi:hypothetical protein
MNKQPKLWEILAAFLPIVIGMISWIWNISTTVTELKKDRDYMRSEIIEYRSDVKDIKKNIELISLELKDKENRK